MRNISTTYKRNRDNPYNTASPLYKSLTRLLSGPIVNYKQENTRIGRRKDLDKYKFTSATGKAFKKSSAYNPFKEIQTGAMANASRAERYMDFEQMELTPEIASALDIYADEITTYTQFSPLLKIVSPNQEIAEILDFLFYEVLNIELNAHLWTRTACKYGDLFLYLDIDSDKGVTNAIGLPAFEVERLEGEDPTNPNYVQFQWNAGGLTFENWQIAHIRILGNDKFVPYGSSVLEGARRIWRQLTLLEDAVMAYRIIRSPERKMFKIDVGGIDPKDVPTYMEQVRTELKRNQVVDPSTGRVDLRYNPLSIEEDYFIPVRKGDSSNIETLAGGSYTGDIDDVKYLRDKLFTALKIPASYLSQGEGMEEKSSLAQKDIMFARTIIRIQNTIASELRKIAIIHLATLGYKGNDLINFDLSFHNPSRISELQELEYMRTKFSVAVEAKDLYSQTWIDKNILSMSDEEIIRNRMEKFSDVKFEISLEAYLEQGGGLDMDGGPGIASGGAGEGLGGMPDMDKVDNSAPPGSEGGEEDLLAVSPTEDDVAELNGQPRKRDLSRVQKDARRNSSPTEKSLEPQAKGSIHHAVKKNHDQRVYSGPRKRSRRNASGGFVGSPSMEELFGGLNTGLANLTRGVFESESLDEDEQMLTEIHDKIKTTLISKKDLINKSISNMNKSNRHKINMDLEEDDA